MIALSFIGRFTPQARESYVKLRLSLDRSEGIRAQRNFFASNNPFQPVVGNKLSAEEASLHVAEARQALRQFWKGQGAAKKDGPSIRDMAEQVGLISSYEYIYFAASNFLHFNPHALMRTGWGKEEGPFVFGTGNFSLYYKDLSRFYAACIYLGFCSSFADYLGQDRRVLRASMVEELLEDFQRWPELVTFEELNLKPPLFFFMHAMKQVARGDSANEGKFDALLHELKGLSGISTN